MKAQTPNRRHRLCRGVTATELVIVMGVLSMFAGMTVPSFLNARRTMRANGMIREVAAQLRQARQEAMSGVCAVTFQYDNQNKQIVVIRHATTGRAVLTAGNYPNNGIVLRRVPLAGGGTRAEDLTYGLPPGVNAPVLGDNTTISPLPLTGTLNVTFHADGSVINAQNGDPANFALFFYNTRAGKETSTAISVLGAAGRIKMWRYDINANTYIE